MRMSAHAFLKHKIVVSENHFNRKLVRLGIKLSIAKIKNNNIILDLANYHLSCKIPFFFKILWLFYFIKTIEIGTLMLNIYIIVF